MPTIEAKRDGTCNACQRRIRKSEFIHYTRETGATHIECSGQPVTRTNLKPARCSECSARVAPNQGRLWYSESQRTDGTWERKWITKCSIH